MRRVTICPSAHVVSCADETIVLDADRGVFYRLNATATALWAVLEDIHDSDAAIAVAARAVCRRCNADPNQVRQDLAALLAVLHRNGLVKEER